MNKKEILSGYQQMRQDITVNKDRCLVKILAELRTYFKKFPKEEWTFAHFIAKTEVDDLIFETLEKTYAITSKAVKSLYNIDTDPINTVDIAEFMYSADNKTLYDRLKMHFENACERDNPLDYMFNRYVLIVDTETSCVSNGIIHGKVHKHAKYVEIHGGADCTQEEGPCEYWISKGKMPIEDLEELPPYHPDCECEVIYYIEKE